MMKKLYNDQLKEIYYETTLKNGLTVYLMPKPGFNKTFGMFATNYGSLDNDFIPYDGDDFVQFPLGIAHFLEHKVFEQEGGKDASSMLASIGASANAFTSFDKTAYLFSTTSEIEQAVNLLLDFVQNPQFSDESVLAEQGIIEQELLMYLDNPQVALTMGALQAMYSTHSIRLEIGGTRDSIKQITKPLLKRCYHTFYHPHNMVFVLVGAFDEKQILQVIKANQNKKTFPPYKPIKRRYFPENNQVSKNFIEQKMAVIIPKTSVNLKIGYEKLSIKEVIKQEFVFQILSDIYFDQSSDFYQVLKEKGIINNSFEYDAVFDETYGFLSISCETLEVNRFNQAVKEKLLRIRTDAIDELTFERIKKVNLALLIRKLNSLEYLANLLVDAAFKGIEAFEVLNILESITYQDVMDFRKYFVEKAIAIFQITPENKLT